jgi:hypothetical protein
MGGGGDGERLAGGGLAGRSGSRAPAAGKQARPQQSTQGNCIYIPSIHFKRPLSLMLSPFYLSSLGKSTKRRLQIIAFR